MEAGHCGLRSGLVLIGKHPDGKCELGDSETVKHELLQCKIYSSQRWTLCRKLGADRETDFNMCRLLNLDSWVKQRNWWIIFTEQDCTKGSDVGVDNKQ